MAQSKKHLKKALRIREHQYGPEQLLGYDEAMALVRNLRRLGRYAEGQFCLEQVCDQIKTIPEPRLYLLNVYLDLMQIDKAKILVDEVRNKFPRDNAVLTNCSRYFQVINDMPSAVGLLDRAIALHPGNDENYVARGLALLAAGETSDGQRRDQGVPPL